MKKILILFIAMIYLNAQTFTLNDTKTSLYFSPNGGATTAIVEQISKAKSEVLVQAYSFTSAPILNELVRAHQRGVKVVVVADKSNDKEKATPIDNVVSQGIETLIDTQHAIAHNKIIIIDTKIVITGSFNFSKAAEEKNAENLLILENKQLASAYKENFLQHKAHSTPYSANTPSSQPQQSQSQPHHHESFMSKFKSLLGL